MARTAEFGDATLAHGAFGRIRAEILAGVHEPGARLSPRRVADTVGVSVSVVREALTRLAEQGFLVAEPHQGFRVTTLDLDAVRDLYETRILIECAAIVQAVEHADVEYESRVVASHHRLSRTPRAGEDGSWTREWVMAHHAFHLALLSACPNQRLTDLAESLRETAEFCRHTSQRALAADRRDIAAEHVELMEAAIAGDAPRAQEALRVHIQGTLDLLTGAADSGGDS